MRKRPPPAPSGDWEYLQLVADAERCVRNALEREQRPPVQLKLVSGMQRSPESDQE